MRRLLAGFGRIVPPSDVYYGTGKVGVASTSRPHTSNGKVRWLTPEEGKALLDREAHRSLGMGGEEFLRAWDAGEIEDPDRPEVMHLYFLIPFAR
jgi:hypothetical protein